MTAHAGLARLLRPRHVAVFGGRFAAEVVRQCQRIGFAGEIWPVHPSHAQVAGRPCFRHVDALPEAPDASFVAVPREATVEVVEALARRGAGGAVCYASGFAEVGEEGERLQTRLRAAAGDMALVGPNCYGVLNYLDGAALWPDQHGGRRTNRGVAIVTQSGNVGISITMQQRSLPLAMLISVGNQAGLGIADYVDTLVEDARIRAIGLHLETIGDVARFSRAAIAARERGIPLVALKVGRSLLGTRAALSHTRSLTGNDVLHDALFERLGIARVRSLAVFLETLKLLAVTGPLRGYEIASISSSGGEAALIADLAEDLGLTLPPFDDVQAERLRAQLGALVSVANPLDYHTFIWGDPEAQRECFATVLGGRQHITLKVLDFPNPAHCDAGDWQRTLGAFVAAKQDTGAAAAVLSTLPENLPEAARDTLIAAGITPLQGLDEGLHAVQAAARIGEALWRKDPPQPVNAPVSTASAIVTLDAWESRCALQAFGVPMPEAHLADAQALESAAEAIGYPVVLKALAEGLAHKTDRGGVALDLRDAKALRAAAQSMASLTERFIVETMAPRPLAELLIGVTRDPALGLALTIGAGGVLVELLRDTRTLLFPISATDVARALDALQFAPLLDGYRGRARADHEAVLAAIMAVAAYAEANAARLEELDVNPLLVLAEGEGVLAVDALIRLRQEE